MTYPGELPISPDNSEGLCFGCGQRNPIGLKLCFKREGNTAIGEFMPSQHFEGEPGQLHRGIVACMFDEAMAYAIGRSCVTAKMDIKFLKPAPIGQPLVVTSSVTRNTRRLFKAKARLSLRDGTSIAEGAAVFFTFNNRRKPRPDRHGK